MTADKIQPHHLSRKALLYVRQSSAHQVLHNSESGTLQCQTASKIGSDALSVTIGSRGADDPCLKQIEFSSPENARRQLLAFRGCQFAMFPCHSGSFHLICPILWEDLWESATLFSSLPAQSHRS